MRAHQRLAAVLSFGICAAMSGQALALPTGIYITTTAMDPKSPTFEKDLKKAQKSVLTKEGNAWKINFVAYLNKPAGAQEVNLVFYDVTGGKKEQGNAYPVGTNETAKIIMSSVDLTEEQNFSAGHKYEVRITRVVDGKEVVFATTKLQLK